MISKLLRRLIRSRPSRWLFQRIAPGDRAIILNETWNGLNSGLNYGQRYALLRKVYRDRRMPSYVLLPSTTHARIHGLFSLVAEVTETQGDIVECGVGRGISLAALVYAVSFYQLGKAVYGFDSFSGFPAAAVHDLGSRVTEIGRVPSGWTDTSLELIASIFEFERASVESLLSQHNVAVRVIPGFFHDTLAANLPNEIALLHVDCDLYDSTKAVLEHCLPRMSPGGIIVFDEYHDERWPGARRAADEVCTSKGFEVTYFERAARFGVRIPSLQRPAYTDVELSECKQIV